MPINTRQMLKPRDKAGVDRQRLMAEAMMGAGQSGAPPEWNRMRVTPEYGLGNVAAQLAQAMGGAYVHKRADEAEKEIDAQRRKKLAEAMGIPAMTQGYEAPTDGVGPVRDPNNLQAARQKQQDLQRFNDTVPLDIQEQIMQQRAITQAFPAPPKTFSGTVGKDEIAYVDGKEAARGPAGAGPDSRTDDQREYEQAVTRDGYKGSLQDWIIANKKAGANSVTVNTGDATLPKPGEGLYRPDAKKPGLKFEPGSEQERAYKEARTKATQAMSSSMGSMQRTWQTVDELLKMDTSGITGSMQGTNLGGLLTRPFSGKASNAHAKLQTLLAQMGFKELADMRAASPTGGALGSITEKELAFLQNAAATLMTTQDDAQFRAALMGIQQQLQNSAASIHQGFKTDFDEAYQQPPPNPVITPQNPQQPPAPVPPTGRAPPSNQTPPLEAVARANSYY
jgi:hypothetical protein